MPGGKRNTKKTKTRQTKTRIEPTSCENIRRPEVDL